MSSGYNFSYIEEFSDSDHDKPVDLCHANNSIAKLDWFVSVKNKIFSRSWGLGTEKVLYKIICKMLYAECKNSLKRE